MANITRIKAKDDAPAPEKSSTKPSSKPPAKPKPKTKLDKKQAKQAKKTIKQTQKATKRANKKPHSKLVRILLIPTKPFTALGRYIRGSWGELRQVHWPDRKLTWKMTLSVIAYVIIFAGVIMLLDLLFTFIFNNLLGA